MAFGGYDGSVRIKADLNHVAFDRGLAAMTGKVQTFGNTLKKISGVVAVAFGTAALIRFSKESVKAASALNDAWIGLESIVSGQGKSFSKAKDFINDYISDGLVPLENAVTAYKNLAARGYSTEQIEQLMRALKDSASFGRQSSYTLGQAVQTATEGLKNENSILVDNAGVTKNVSVMWREYAQSIGVGEKSLTLAQRRQAEVNGILKETRFQTGDAAKLVNTYSGQIAMLGYNFQQLKVKVGNALIPIAQAVLPSINAIIAGLTRLADVFAQVTAMLFGKSAQVTAATGIASSAASAADATDGLAEATANAGNASKQAAKDMKGVLAGFDELNVLADNASSSVDGAAGGMDMGDLGAAAPSYTAEVGEVDQLSEAFKSLGEIFVETLDKMLAGIPAFQSALLGFAGDFNEFNQKLYDAFTFPGLQEKVQQLGAELADAFNSLVAAIDWTLWGQKLGAGIDLGLQFLVDFLYQFDWLAFGKSLGELVSGAVSEIDWYAVGQKMIAGFKIAIELLTGFLLGLDMAQLAQAASQVAIGYFNSLQDTLANIDWEQIGAQVAEFLNGIDWAGVISAIAGALEEMVSAGLGLLSGFIANADPETLLVAAAFLGSKLLGGIVSKVITPLAKDIVSNLISNIAGAITSSGFGAILEKISTVLGVIGTTLAGIGTIIAGVATAAVSFFSMWENGFSIAKEVVMVLGTALTAVGAIILGAPALVAAVVAAIVAAVATAVIIIKEHWEDILNFYRAMWETIKEIAGTIAEWFKTNVIEPVKAFFSEMWDSLKTFASDAWAFIQETWTVVSNWFSENVIQPVAKFFGDMWTNIGQAAKDIWSAIKSAWNEAGSWFTQHVTEPLRAAFDAAGNAIKHTINGLIGNVESLINGVIRGVNWLISQLNKIRIDIPDDVPIIGGTRFGINIPSVSEVTLPRLANGAVIPPNQQFAAILGDQRSGMNVEAPLATIEKAVENAMSRMGGGNIRITVESILDGKVIARNTVRHINSMTRSSGRSPLYT